jgi:hypothetical protein
MDSKEDQNAVVDIKKPKRVIHCSDGIYEEYSSDEEEKQEKKKSQIIANNVSLFKKISSTIINAVDYVGNGLAEFLNITTPKYSYEIGEAKRLEEIVKEERMHESAWNCGNEENSDQKIINEQPPMSKERF